MFLRNHLSRSQQEIPESSGEGGSNHHQEEQLDFTSDVEGTGDLEFNHHSITVTNTSLKAITDSVSLIK